MHKKEILYTPKNDCARFLNHFQTSPLIFFDSLLNYFITISHKKGNNISCIFAFPSFVSSKDEEVKQALTDRTFLNLFINLAFLYPHGFPLPSTFFSCEFQLNHYQFIWNPDVLAQSDV